MLAVLAPTLTSPMVFVVSLADEPAVEDSQFDWPLKLKLWFRASRAWAVGCSSKDIHVTPKAGISAGDLKRVVYPCKNKGYSRTTKTTAKRKK